MMFQMGLSEFQVLDLHNTENEPPLCLLYIYEGPSRMNKVEVTGDGIDIGRDPSNGLAVVSDSQMSNYHASISYDTGKYLLCDEGSTNKYCIFLLIFLFLEHG